MKKTSLIQNELKWSIFEAASEHIITSYTITTDTGRPIRGALNPTKSSHSDNSPALMRHSPEVNAGGATRLHKPKGARPVRWTINPSKNCHSGHIPGLTSQSQDIHMGTSSASRLHLHSQVSNYSISGARPDRWTINPSKNCHSEHIPGLTSQSQDIDMGRSSASRLLKSQVTVVKAPPSETNEFTMSSEDFPELPGTQRMEGPSPGGSLTVEKNLSVSSSDIGQETTVGNRAPGAEKSQTKRGIQTSLDGRPIRAALNPTKSSHSDNSPALMRHSPEVNAGGATRLHKPKGARPVRWTINPSKNCHSGHIPGLTSQSQGIDMGRSSASRLLKSQVTVVKAPPSETNEFTMSSEDFPELPGTQRMEGPSPGGSLTVEKNLSVSSSDIGQVTTVGNRAPGAEKSQTKRGIQTSLDGARPVRWTINPSKNCHSGHIPGLTSQSQDIHMGRSSASRLHLHSQVSNYSISGARPVRSTINPSKNCHSEHIPGLTSQSQGIDMGRSSASRLLKSQVTVVKAPSSEMNEFTMSLEDFPELPGTQRMEGPSPGGSLTVEKNLSVSSSDIGQETTVGNRAPGAEKSQTKRGIQTSLDGKVTGIPGSMVKEQFGMVGLLTFIRAALTDHKLVSLALGQDLTALGLNLNTRDHLYPNFGGPWAETPCRPQDIDLHVPPEYLNNANIRYKLRPVQFNRYDDDLLFYMFYTNIGDVAQLAAATELYNRGWRYHIEEKVWITLPPGMWADVKTYTYERGTYLFFDAQNWRKVRKEFLLYYSKLEGRPQIPSTINQSPIVM